MCKLKETELHETLLEAIAYSAVIMQEKVVETIRTAKACLRELLDSLVPDDKVWVLQKLGDWMNEQLRDAIKTA